MRAPLAVRIRDGGTDRHVTRAVTGLSFTKNAPGGHASAQLRLDLPADAFGDLGPSDRVWIYDGRTGDTVWEGYCENPGVERGEAGEGFDVTAIGGMALPGDESRALVYVDRDLGGWEKFTRPLTPTSGEMSATARPDAAEGAAGADEQGLLLQYQSGQPVPRGSSAGICARYDVAARSGMEVGSFSATFVCGRRDPGYEIDLVSVAQNDTLASTVLATVLTTTAFKRTRWSGVAAHFPAGTEALAVRLYRDGLATNVATGDVWAWLSDVVLCARRMTRHGVLLTGAAQSAQSTVAVKAGWVVEDLVGRLLPVDPDACTIAPGSALIEQLAYPDGATARQVLDDLELYEPDHLWEMLESTPAGHRFAYRQWPTEPRYEVTTSDGYDAPGGEADLCNRVAVYWTDKAGVRQTTVVTSAVPALAGRVRDAEPITLPDGQGSAADAQRIGAQVLATKAEPSKSAKVTIRRPLMDRLTGAQVWPWQLEPGYLARVRETGDVLRVTEMTYSDDDASAELTLGEPTLTVEQRIAAMYPRSVR